MIDANPLCLEQNSAVGYLCNDQSVPVQSEPWGRRRICGGWISVGIGAWTRAQASTEQQAVIPYVEPKEEKQNDFGSTFTSTMPMAAVSGFVDIVGIED